MTSICCFLSYIPVICGSLLYALAKSGVYVPSRKCEISLEGKSPSSGRELTSIDDLFEEAGCYPFSWLPPKYRLPLRLFVEEVLAIDASDDKVRGDVFSHKVQEKHEMRSRKGKTA